ncbi:MAG: UDP-2,3-diacylglucosamine diphosphatase [Ignavibacteriae bacterium HGW-Ignavibacteriae-3]|nr:MAG: UDP-2,3-diacylglucosamine diphosphatase [Ignavibacteriae bacterium HGW-Ignavibacteriae-3]
MSLNKNYYFISDVHLGLHSNEIERETEKKLVNFLDFAKETCDELFIIGDLFDFWFEYKRVIQKGFIRTLSKLSELPEAGKKVHYIIGNHDFLHRDFFEKEIGVFLYHDPLDILLNDKKFFLAHGDGLVKNDLGYKILKKILRNKSLQRIYSLVHPDLGIKIASATSKTSRDYTSTKNYGEIDGLFESAKIKIDSGFDYVMFGHSHRRTFKKYNKGTYINLGSWLELPCYGKFNDSFEIIDWE